MDMAGQTTCRWPRGVRFRRTAKDRVVANKRAGAAYPLKAIMKKIGRV
jgi:hypothetical protein